MKPFLRSCLRSFRNGILHSVNYILLSLFLAILTGIIVLGICARQSNRAYVRTSEQIEWTNNVLSETSILETLDEENETELRNYILTDNVAPSQACGGKKRRDIQASGEIQGAGAKQSFPAIKRKAAGILYPLEDQYP